jgi:hypothetical protein
VDFDEPDSAPFELQIRKAYTHIKRGFVKHTLNAARPDLKVFTCLAQGPLAIGRLLLVFATISLLTMPLTQHVWTWDHFLHGGQDFESVMLGIVIMLCLAVLLSQLCKQLVDSLFAACRPRAFAFIDRELAGTSRSEALFVGRMEQLTDATKTINRLPLKI